MFLKNCFYTAKTVMLVLSLSVSALFLQGSGCNDTNPLKEVKNGDEGGNTGGNGNNGNNGNNDNNTRDVTYTSLTFGDVIDGAKGDKDATDYSAFAANSKNLIFGTTSNPGYVSYYPIAGGTATHLKLEGPGVGGGNTSFLMQGSTGGFYKDEAIVKTIITKDNTVFLGIEGLGFDTGVALFSNKGGIVQLKQDDPGMQVTALWRNRQKDMDFGPAAAIPGFSPASANHDIPVVNVVGNNMFAFVDTKDSYGTHVKIDATTVEKTKKGPALVGDKVLGKIVIATAIKDDKMLFIATDDGNVYKIDDATNLDTTKIDFTTPFIEGKDLKEAGSQQENNTIQSLAVKGNELFIGLRFIPVGDKKETGGIVTFDLTTTTKKDTQLLGASISKIMVSGDNIFAIANTGIVVSVNGKFHLITSKEDADKFTEAAANESSPEIKFGNGFDFAKIKDFMGAACVADTCYASFAGQGILPVKIETKTKKVPK